MNIVSCQKKNYLGNNKVRLFQSGLVKMKLVNYRNHKIFTIDPPIGPVAIVGSNGAGKTNIIEGISLFSAGKGIRRAKFADMIAFGECGFSVSAHLYSNKGFTTEIATSFNIQSKQRKTRVDGENGLGGVHFAKKMSLLWLGPGMDRLFTDSPSTRLRYIDRLFSGIDINHAGWVTNYSRLLRQRSFVLKTNANETSWLNALEIKLAELAVIVASSRLDITNKIISMMHKDEDFFPTPEILFKGRVENMLESGNSLDTEKQLADIWKSNRTKDLYTGGSEIGVHRSDFQVFDKKRTVSAQLCSTGEQKALLIAIILAAAKVISFRDGQTPILLLDEVFAHLDEDYKLFLSNEIISLGAQVWMTGSAVDNFDCFKKKCEIFKLKNNKG